MPFNSKIYGSVRFFLNQHPSQELVDYHQPPQELIQKNVIGYQLYLLAKPELLLVGLFQSKPAHFPMSPMRP